MRIFELPDKNPRHKSAFKFSQTFPLSFHQVMKAQRTCFISWLITIITKFLQMWLVHKLVSLHFCFLETLMIVINWWKDFELSNSDCNHTCDNIYLITRMITERIGIHSVLLPLLTNLNMNYRFSNSYELYYPILVKPMDFQTRTGTNSALERTCF